MQPIPTSSPYAIGTLLLRLMQESGLSESQFVRNTGINSTTKALRRLSRWVNTGNGSRDFLMQVAKAYNVPTDQIHKALETDRSNIAAEAERTFLPFLEARVERSSRDQNTTTQPQQITLYGLVGGDRRRRVSLPELDRTSPLDQQLPVVIEKLNDHYLKSGGKLLLLGTIRSYLLWLSPTRAVRLSIEGAVLEEVADLSASETHTSLRKGRALPPFFAK